MNDFLDNFVQDFYTVFIEQDRYLQLLEGVRNTLIITVCALLVGVVIGVFIALVRVHHLNTGKLKVLDAICRVYVTVIRGIPMVVQLLIMFMIILSFMENRVLMAIIAFGINSGAYVSEIIRGGIMSIDKGQMEAGRSLGLGYRVTMQKIILPQAIKNILPALGNELISLLKETSIAGYVAVVDLTKSMDQIKSRTSQTVIPYLTIAVIYLLLVMLISKGIKILERRFAKSDRR